MASLKRDEYVYCSRYSHLRGHDFGVPQDLIPSFLGDQRLHHRWWGRRKQGHLQDHYHILGQGRYPQFLEMQPVADALVASVLWEPYRQQDLQENCWEDQSSPQQGIHLLAQQSVGTFVDSTTTGPAVAGGAAAVANGVQLAAPEAVAEVAVGQKAVPPSSERMADSVELVGSDPLDQGVNQEDAATVVTGAGEALVPALLNRAHDILPFRSQQHHDPSSVSGRQLPRRQSQVVWRLQVMARGHQELPLQVFEEMGCDDDDDDVVVVAAAEPEYFVADVAWEELVGQCGGRTFEVAEEAVRMSKHREEDMTDEVGFVADVGLEDSMVADGL